jgi:hypothetical protein
MPLMSESKEFSNKEIKELLIDINQSLKEHQMYFINKYYYII